MKSEAFYSFTYFHACLQQITFVSIAVFVLLTTLAPSHLQ